jgi:hydrogenase nickel incorporation protein HypA/HybF
MHEDAIARKILEAGRAEAARLAGARLARIGVRVGAFTGVDLEALDAALTELRAGGDLEKVVIEIQRCPGRCRCMSCGHEFETALTHQPCPKCAGQQVEVIGGNELELSFVEVGEG